MGNIDGIELVSVLGTTVGMSDFKSVGTTVATFSVWKEVGERLV